VGNKSTAEHRDSTPVLAAIGGGLLLLGVTAAVFLVPLLLDYLNVWPHAASVASPWSGFVHCSMITACCLFAAMLIPLGYGHVKVRRWAWTLSMTFCHVWLVLGAFLTLLFVSLVLLSGIEPYLTHPLTLLFAVSLAVLTGLLAVRVSSGSPGVLVLFMAPLVLLVVLAVCYIASAKGSQGSLLLGLAYVVYPSFFLLGALVSVAWPVVPWLLIRFYQSRNVILTFEMKDGRTHWTDRVPVPILVVTSLFVFYVIAVPFAMMLNGVFPLFGVLLSGDRGMLVLSASALPFLVLVCGTLRQRVWAWWGALICIGALLISSTVTFPRLSYSEILETMNVPPPALERLQRIPFEGGHFALFVGAPLLIAVVKVIMSRNHFGEGSGAGSAREAHGQEN
jgi:hypothetical protein